MAYMYVFKRLCAHANSRVFRTSKSIHEHLDTRTYTDAHLDACMLRVCKNNRNICTAHAHLYSRVNALALLLSCSHSYAQTLLFTLMFLLLCWHPYLNTLALRLFTVNYSLLRSYSYNCSRDSWRCPHVDAPVYVWLASRDRV